MGRLTVSSAVLFCAIGLGLGCGKDLDATSQAWCQRADGCELLPSTVTECTNQTLQWLDTQIPDGIQDDCDEALKECNDRSSCQSYVACSFSENSLAFQCHPFVLDGGG